MNPFVALRARMRTSPTLLVLVPTLLGWASSGCRVGTMEQRPLAKRHSSHTAASDAQLLGTVQLDPNRRWRDAKYLNTFARFLLASSEISAWQLTGARGIVPSPLLQQDSRASTRSRQPSPTLFFNPFAQELKKEKTRKMDDIEWDPKPAPPVMSTEAAALRLTLTVTDLEEGIFGLDSKDPRYGIEILKQKVTLPLGLLLTEEMVQTGMDERRMALVKDVFPDGGAVKADFKPGDMLTFFVLEANGRRPGENRGAVRVEGFNIEQTTDALKRVSKEESSITVVSKRLVPRQVVNVTVLQPDGTVAANFNCRSGLNLRAALLSRNIRLYDEKTKRFDNPWATGDCAGEGLCGTCMVDAQEGADSLSPRGREEDLLLENRPDCWRLSCRTFVGKDNKPGTELTVRLRPQSDDQK